MKLLITVCQPGILSGDSSTLQFLTIIRETQKSFDESPPTDTIGIFLELS